MKQVERQARAITSLHLPQYDEIYTKVKNRIGRLIKSRRKKPRGYRTLAVEILDTAHNIIVDKLRAYRDFYYMIKENPQLLNYVKDVYGTQGLQTLRQAAYLDASVTRLWRTLRKHLQYMPLDGIVNESLNYVARLLSVVKRRQRLLKDVLEIKKDVSKTPLVKKGSVPVIIVGAPNSGKSTLVSKIANVDFEVGDYPFTTKRAQAAKKPISKWIDTLIIDTPGIVNIREPNIIERRAIAFIKQPGTIVVYLIDPSTGASLPLSEQIRLLKYIAELNPNIIVAINKMDAVGERLDELKKLLETEFPYHTILVISALKGLNLNTLINAIKERIQEVPREHKVIAEGSKNGF